MDGGISSMIAYLAGALADGGCYYLRYKGKRTEYRCVWTQKDPEWLAGSIIPRLRSVMRHYNIPSKIQLIKGETRYEVRVSSKKLYVVLTSYMEKLPDILHSNQHAARAWLAGLYDAEGDKTGRRTRIWSKDKGKLILAKTMLESQGIKAYGPHLENKKKSTSVYVLEVSSLSRTLFLNKVRPEHPKLAGKNTLNPPARHPREFRRA